MGGKLDMVCAATGYPSPTVKIMKQNNSGTVVLRTATQTVQYLIESLQPFDGGKYICIAKNIAGDMEKDILVEIKCKFILFLACACVLCVDLNQSACSFSNQSP